MALRPLPRTRKIISQFAPAVFIPLICLAVAAVGARAKPISVAVPMSDEELKIRQGAQTSVQGWCATFGACNSSQNVNCPGDFTQCDPNVVDGCKPIGGTKVTNQVTYKNPQSCYTTGGPGIACFTGNVVNVLCKETTPCRCKFVPNIWICKIDGETTNNCRNIEVGISGPSMCSYQTCP